MRGLVAQPLLSCIIALSFATTVYATDLPIDITAIGRQGGLGGQVTTRIGANLFSDDAHRVNETFAEQIRHRQETALYLFAEVPLNYAIDPHIQIMTAADDFALFAQPTNFSNFSMSQEDESIPIWLTASIFAVCIIAGFIFALISRKKRRRKGDVY